MNLGRSTRRGALDTANPVLAGGWTIKWDPANLPRMECEAYHAAVKGPTASTFQVYVDTTFYGNVARGDINDWDPVQPLHIPTGSTVYYYYDTASGSAPEATLFFRTVSPL